ncbi:hypothetical protein OC844_007154 [Tilletia horrida]|nr:hypothetical protein OC844_007154 [Tilletia horrida]
MQFGKVFAPLAASVALIAALPAAALERGIPWPGQTGNQWTGSVNGDQIGWYHHYDQLPVEGFYDLEYVPMYYSQNLYAQWQTVKNFLSSGAYRPANILAFNEPDQPSQANMSPQQAAQQWNQELRPYQQQGIAISSPQISYSQDWLGQFMSILQNQYGASPDFIALHFYGTADQNGLNGLRSYVEAIHNAYGKDIWLTELGVQAANNPSEQQVDNWLHQSLEYLQGTGFVKRVAWFGAFAQNQNPDNYVSNYNAYYSSADDGSLTELGNDWCHNPNLRRRNLPRGLRRQEN